LASCSNDNSVTNPLPDGDPGPALVSDPVAFGGAAAVAPGAFATLAAQTDFSFTAFLPGEYPGGETAEILNQRTGERISAPMLEGGLDPVGIPAEVGDVLEISILAGQTLLARMFRPVPERKPPVVVRTQPPDGKTKVPLNLSITVVFSEPIDAGSVTAESFRLLRDGEPVPGEIRIIDGGLRAEFAPDEELLRSTEYTIALTTDVDDLSGDALEAAYEVSFTTDNPPLTGKIVFEGRQTGIGEIYFMNPDGTGVVQVTDRVDGGWSVSPSVSPNGTKIAFSGVNNAGTAEEEWDIYVVNVDGTDLRNVTDNPAFDGWRPTWSEDGERIAFFSNRDGNAEIYTIRQDGSDLRRVTDDPADDSSPSWSPDGSRIAFVSDRGGSSEIWIANVDGTGAVQLTDGRGGDWPSWSPDGTEIAFDTNGFILRVATDGSQYTELAAGSAPAWSPDGSMIAFNRVGGDIYLMNSDGTDVRRVGSGLFPSWGP
jgi:TolB protein